MKKPSLFAKIAAGTVALGVGVAMLPIAIATDDYVHNGLTSQTAAASCWEVKQNTPDAKSGTYWLQTPLMDTPEQFYCDQETDGGGWVMIARGREGWTEDYNGKGKASELYNNPEGTTAFSPVQLPGKTIQALTNEQAPKNYEDGIRLRRAANVQGTEWQEIRAKQGQTNEWAWTLRANNLWSSIEFRNPSSIGNSFTGRNIYGKMGNWNGAYNAVTFNTSAKFNWNLGFGYGMFVNGSADANSYMWAPQGNSPLAFTQVYLRPRLTQKDVAFAQIGDEGLASSQNRQLPNNYSAAMVWRTSEESGTGENGELNTRVQAIAEVNNTVFTGGDFKNVVSAGGETVSQAYLAGYDVNTAELVRSFRPTFNGQIKALEGMSNGKLAVGGEFTQVNGQDVPGFVILDPVTGQIDKTYQWALENRVSGLSVHVKTIQEANGYLYIGGSFTHINDGIRRSAAYARNAARFNIATGGVDSDWRPVFNGTVNGLSASEDGTSVFAAGYFTTLHGATAHKLAHLNTTDGKLKMPWDWKLSYTSLRNPSNQGFQFDVQDAPNSVWAAGAEHLIAQYNKSTMDRLYSAITLEGGDFQDLYRDANSNIIYGACHCGDWIYESADTYGSPWLNSTDVHRIRLVAAWDANTGEVIPEFSPEMAGAKGHGVWESFVDSTGTLWVGGDIVKSLGAYGVQKTVGFARYAPRDTSIPAAAQNLTVTSDGTTDELTWVGTGVASTTYQVLRNDRVIATVKNPGFSVEHVDGARYFVRSVNAAGNFSATTPVAVAEVTRPEPTEEPTTETPAPDEDVAPDTDPIDEEPKPIEDATDDPEAPVVEDNPNPAPPVEPVEPEKPADQEVFAAGSDWHVAFNLYSPWDTTWRNLDYRYDTAQTWYLTKTSIGWGEPSVAQPVSFGYWTHPMSMLLRKDIEVDAQPGQKLVLTTYADDGIAVYINGKEVKRHNLRVGAYPGTPASSSVSYAVAKANPITIEIPASELNQGRNTIAVEVHSYRRAEPTTFDMQAVLTTE